MKDRKTPKTITGKAGHRKMPLRAARQAILLRQIALAKQLQARGLEWLREHKIKTERDALDAVAVGVQLERRAFDELYGTKP